MRSEILTIKQVQSIQDKDQIDNIDDYTVFIKIQSLKEKGFYPIVSDNYDHFCYQVQCNKCSKVYQENQGYKILKHFLNHKYGE